MITFIVIPFLKFIFNKEFSLMTYIDHLNNESYINVRYFLYQHNSHGVHGLLFLTNNILMRLICCANMLTFTFHIFQSSLVII